MMKLNNKETAIALGIVGVSAFFLSSKIEKMTNSNISNSAPIKGTAKEALQKVAQKYGKAYAQDCERVIRLETAHFTSGQWLKCGTAGMVATSNIFPYGWSSLRDYTEENGIPESSFGLVHFSKTSEGAKTYIRFPETGFFVEFFADFIKNKRGGDWTKWFRLNDPIAQANYKKKYQAINATLV